KHERTRLLWTTVKPRQDLPGPLQRHCSAQPHRALTPALSGLHQLSIAAFHEKDHINDLRARVFSLAFLACVEVQCRNAIALDNRCMAPIKIRYSTERFPSEGRYVEASLEVEVKRWDTSENAQHDLRHQNIKCPLRQRRTKLLGHFEQRRA